MCIPMYENQRFRLVMIQDVEPLVQACKFGFHALDGGSYIIFDYICFATCLSHALHLSTISPMAVLLNGEKRGWQWVTGSIESEWHIVPFKA